MRSIFQGSYTDGLGKAVQNGTIVVYLTGTTTAAIIYSVSTGGSQILTGATTSDLNGYFFFYVDTADYSPNQLFDVTLSAPGFNNQTWKRITIFPSPELSLDNPTYGATVTIDQSLGSLHRITATNATAFTISNPINSVKGNIVTIMVRNASGGALGALTFDTSYKMGAAWTQPANGFSRTIQFWNDGTNFVEISRTAADVSN